MSLESGDDNDNVPLTPPTVDDSGVLGPTDESTTEPVDEPILLDIETGMSSPLSTAGPDDLWGPYNSAGSGWSLDSQKVGPFNDVAVASGTPNPYVVQNVEYRGGQDNILASHDPLRCKELIESSGDYFTPQEAAVLLAVGSTLVDVVVVGETAYTKWLIYLDGLPTAVYSSWEGAWLMETGLMEPGLMEPGPSAAAQTRQLDPQTPSPTNAAPILDVRPTSTPLAAAGSTATPLTRLGYESASIPAVLGGFQAQTVVGAGGSQGVGALYPLLRLQQGAGNAAVVRTLSLQGEGPAGNAPSEAERFKRLQQSQLFRRDPDVSSVRNHFIDLYEQVASAPPETYVGNIYSQAVPRSATQSNYSAAAAFTARDPVNNRTRWALQAALTQYALTYGYDEMARRAQASTEFSYQIHQASFQFANDVDTIGRMTWALLTRVNVPTLGESIGSTIYMPEALLAGLEAGITSLAADPMNIDGANAAFDREYAQVMAQRYTLGGRMINATIESTNSPHGWSTMPWWGIGLRGMIDFASWLTEPVYD